MSLPRVTLVDYGIGNLYSVQRALECAGAEVELAGTPEGIARAQRLVLPGVGAFADGILGLRERKLVEPIMQHASEGRPLLGICLGMQLLASASEEFGDHKGLCLIPGRVTPVPASGTEGQALRIPHIGWKELRPADGAAWRGTLLESTPVNTPVYLVHSYHFVPDDPAHRLACCDYGGRAISAAVHSGSITGCQFHPEKSGPAGLAMLARFIAVQAPRHA